MINVYSTRLEENFAQELLPAIQENKYDIVRIRASRHKTNKKCQIMLERLDKNPVTITDCENVHKIIIGVFKETASALVDYDLEISSPGINKPLTRIKDYVESEGELFKIQTVCKIDNRRNFNGYIKNVGEDFVKINLLDTGDDLDISFDLISEASLEYKKL
jgi:ribosome maturation factor RimP